MPPLRIVTSPDNSFLPGRLDAAAHGRASAACRPCSRSAGARSRSPTGGVVVDIYADDARLAARGGARRSCRSTRSAHPARRCRARLPDTRLRRDAAALAGALAAARAALSAGAAARSGGRELGAAARSGSGRTAIVIRVTAHVRPASSLKRTSHTHVVRPRCRRVACAWTVPSVIGRRKLVLFDRPIAISPSRHHRERGRQRGDRLGDRRVHAAVHEPGRLLELVAHRHLRARPPVVVARAARGRRAGRSPERRG